MKTLKLIVSFFLLISSVTLAGVSDGSSVKPLLTESTNNCTIIQIAGIGDGSGMQPQYILVCQETEKTQ